MLTAGALELSTPIKVTPEMPASPDPYKIITFSSCAEGVEPRRWHVCWYSENVQTAVPVQYRASRTPVCTGRRITSAFRIPRTRGHAAGHESAGLDSQNAV